MTDREQQATCADREARIQEQRDYISALEDRCDELNEKIAAMRWRPLEDAPKDGTWILIGKWADTPAVPNFGIEARPPHLWWAVRGQWSAKWNRWWDGVEPCGLAEPNVFAPLPDAPEAEPVNHEQE